jgi:hypothetical protein
MPIDNPAAPASTRHGPNCWPGTGVPSLQNHLAEGIVFVDPETAIRERGAHALISLVVLVIQSSPHLLCGMTDGLAVANIKTLFRPPVLLSALR